MTALSPAEIEANRRLIESLWQMEEFLEELPTPPPFEFKARHDITTIGSAPFFEFPTASRLAELTQARCAERYRDGWRTPIAYVSVALSSDNPLVLDNGTERALHDGLISATFGFHPMFGTGHILRTNGLICMFWNGEEVNIVEHKNVTIFRLVIEGERKESRRKQALRAAINAD